MRALRRGLAGIVLALGLTLGLVATGVTPASANDQAWSAIYNGTDLSIRVTFHTTWDTFVNRLVPPGSWDGELNGNMSYEPRTFYVGPGYCLMWAQYLVGKPKGSDQWVCGLQQGIYQNIYWGDGNTLDYGTLLEKVFYRGY